MNIFEYLGIGYIGVWTYYLISRVGEYPSYPTEPYEWWMAAVGLVSFVVPFVLGWLGGVSNNR